MDRKHILEAGYPITFREDESRLLGEQLKHRHSVELIGMKRVGISNFLRFFLYHPDVQKKYISKDHQYLFISVDLNDLVERELFPFWTLTLKRVSDAVESSSLPETVKKQIESLFLNSIQLQDLFLLIDNLRRALLIIIDSGMLPTIFFLRFDRINNALTPEFFDNLQGLTDATHQKLSYVLTAFRSLDTMKPDIFMKASLSLFAHTLYVKPANKKDMHIIYDAFKKNYELFLPTHLEQALFSIVAGNVQYLQLSLIILNEHKGKEINTKEELFELAAKDERITLQSEELWESLQKGEKDVLTKIQIGNVLIEQDKIQASYLWKTGFLKNGVGGRDIIFSQLLEDYISHRDERVPQTNHVIHFSKKEHMLFSILHSHLDQICEREEIAQGVWPEYKEFAVSDWAIDRLVARVRSKLKQQKNEYEIITIRTRGYKMVKGQ